MSTRVPHLEIILPVFNEALNIPTLVDKLDGAIASLGKRVTASFLFINDGSTDGTTEILNAMHQRRADVRVIHFIRNFGHNAALACGLEMFQGDIAVFMDADLQDDPQTLQSMLGAWEQGALTVVIERGARPENAGFLFRAFYFLLRKTAKKLPPLNFGTHCLLDRGVIERLRLFQERNRYFPGLVGIASGPITAIRRDRQKRLHGDSRVGFWGLMSLAVTAFVSFSATPIRLVSVVGILCSAGAFASACGIVAVKVFTSLAIPGWASIMTVTLFASGMQSLCLGIIGEYIARMYEEVKQRPLFFIERSLERRTQTGDTQVA